jgi:hypothetical protein
MQRSQLYSHHHAEEVLRDKGMWEEVLALADQPEVAVVTGNSTAIKTQFKNQLTSLGWAIKPRVHDSYNLTINAIRNSIGLTIQTGNIARAFYDLMKFQAMYLNNRLDAAVLILPTSAAAAVFGQNISNFDRVSSEISLFRHMITVPCLLVSFE